MALFNHIPNAMMNSMWLMSILFIIYTAFKYVLKLNPAKSFLLAVSAQITATIFFIISILNPKINSFKISTLNIESSIYWNTWSPYIGILYLISLFAYLIYLLIEYKQLSFLKKSANFETNTYWNQELNKIGIGTFQIGQSNRIKSPITFGWIDAVILLPFSILNHLSVEEVKYILLHEVAHIMRNDFIVQIAINITHTILLFNPFSYFFIKEINLQRELACDEWVLNHHNNPLTYSKSLYQLSLVANSENSQLLLNAIGGQKDLLHRITRIHRLPIKNKLPIIQLLLAFCLFFVCSFGVQFSTSSKNHVVSVKPKKQVPTYYYASLGNDQKSTGNKKTTILVIKKLKAPLPTPTLFKEEEYKAVVSNAINWIKTREDQYQMVNYSKTRDSIEFEVAEKLLLRSLLQNYQLRKELLNAKLANIESEKEALDYLENSKEWHEVLQYENWANTFLKRHPELSIADSLRRF